MQLLLIGGVLAAALGASYLFIRRKGPARKKFVDPTAIDTGIIPEF